MRGLADDRSDAGRHDDFGVIELEGADSRACLLYTSDAADERSSVDLGGRRIIHTQHTEKSG